MNLECAIEFTMEDTKGMKFNALEKKPGPFISLTQWVKASPFGRIGF